MTGPGLLMSTCSRYVPGYMNIDREEESSGREATAEERVLNCPDVVVLGLTTIAPEGGEVREAAHTDEKRFASRARRVITSII